MDNIDYRPLMEKYIVKRSDGTDEPGEKHHDCFLFVLDIDHDEDARQALAVYAMACRTKRPVLAEALLDQLADVELSQHRRMTTMQE